MKSLVQTEGLEPPTSGLKVRSSTIELRLKSLAGLTGIEPARSCLTSKRSTVELQTLMTVVFVQRLFVRVAAGCVKHHHAFWIFEPRSGHGPPRTQTG